MLVNDTLIFNYSSCRLYFFVFISEFVPDVSLLNWDGKILPEPFGVRDIVKSWKFTDKVQPLSFDTTSVNTSHYNDVCVLLESKIDRVLLWLACHHHVIELILAKISTLCYGPSNFPYIPIFKKFKAA